MSNTIALEVKFLWRGLCIEPNPAYWYAFVLLLRITSGHAISRLATAAVAVHCASRTTRRYPIGITNPLFTAHVLCTNRYRLSRRDCTVVAAVISDTTNKGVDMVFSKGGEGGIVSDSLDNTNENSAEDVKVKRRTVRFSELLEHFADEVPEVRLLLRLVSTPAQMH